MSDWIANTGAAPDVDSVHIRLNCDADNWPGVPDERYFQNPKRWDWQRRIGGIEITHYMKPDESQS